MEGTGPAPRGSHLHPRQSRCTLHAQEIARSENSYKCKAMKTSICSRETPQDVREMHACHERHFLYNARSHRQAALAARESPKSREGSGKRSRAPAEGRRSLPSQPRDPAKEAALTFGPSQHKPESLMLPLLQHGRLLLNDVVTGQERAQENDAGVRFQHHAARRRWPSCLRQGDLFSSTVSSQQGVGHNLLPSLPCPESEQKDESYFPSTCRWRKAPAAWITLLPTGPFAVTCIRMQGAYGSPGGSPLHAALGMALASAGPGRRGGRQPARHGQPARSGFPVASRTKKLDARQKERRLLGEFPGREDGRVYILIPAL